MRLMYQDSIDANEIEWTPARFPGVYLKILHGSPESEASVVLRKLEPGAIIPQHYHGKADETVYVLEGDFIEEAKAQGAGHAALMHAAFGHEGEGGQQSLMIEQQMQLHGAFAAPVLRPVKHTGAKFD